MKHAKHAVAVVGVGHTKFGELWDKSLADLLVESQLAAINDAGITATDVDAIFTSNMCAGLFSNQTNLGSLASSLLNSTAASFVVRGACASGGLALAAGIMAIESGQHKVVLVNGVEKMTDVSPQQVTRGLASAASSEWEAVHGATFPSLNAMIARLYMQTYGLTREQLAMVSVQNHEHGFLNPVAHLRRKISINDVINSPMIADPLTLLDCSPISDGAASIILCHESVAERSIGGFNPLTKNPVYIIGSGTATDTLSLSERDDLLTWHATTRAAQTAYEMAGITTDDIDVVELHDGFSIVQILALEDLGFCKKGEGGTFASSKLSINPSGGLKSKGHPVGATGVAQAVEVVQQLRGGCGDRQVSKASIGMTHNVGGCGSTAAVHIFTNSLQVDLIHKRV